MKICKVNGRWPKFKENGYEIVLRFDRWGENARRVETWLKAQYPNQGWYEADSMYFGRFGQARRWSLPKPYFIGLRKESVLSAALLCVEILERD